MTRIPFESDDGMPERDDTPHDNAPYSGAPFDELGLRRLLHDAVRDIEPEPEALDRLARAVPARRTRRRQAMVGAAASMLLVGTAVPAVLHVAETGSSESTGPVNASSSLVPGSSPGAPSIPRQSDTGRSFGQYPGEDVFAGPPGTGPASPQASAPGVLPGGSPAASGGPPAASSPACARTQLGNGTAYTDTPDPDGRVYGAFRVVNVSASSCTVSGAGQIAVSAQGSTDPGQIQVVDHTEGDPASALPDPATVPAALVLPPGQAYQVQFAWIPASGGGTTGCATGATPPSDGGTGSTSGDSAGSGDTGGTNAPNAPSLPTITNAAESVSAADDGGASSEPPAGASSSPTPVADGISLSNVPSEGSPATATATIAGACAGTVYQADPQPTS